MSRVIIPVESGEIDCKRCYLDAKIESDCPHCGTSRCMDLNSEYLSYPDIGKTTKLDMWCSKCDYEWEIAYVLNVSLEIIKPD